MKRDCEGPTFGISLTVLCERSGVEVPLILGDILRWLAAHALAQPDVFAEAPRCAATSQLKSAIDTGASLVELVEGTRPAVVGSLLKRWLEELPDPLLNWDQQVELLSACKDEGCIEARIASLNDAVALVDHLALGTLKPLLLFLQQYCFRQRRFDQQLLQVAVAFAPILFPAALAAGPAELRLAEETVATLVSNALHVFNPTLAANVPVVTPQALCEAAAEIMESQQQHPDDGSCLACTDAAGSYPAHHSGDPELSASAGQQEQAQEEQAAEAPLCEPYLQDGPFMNALNEMVDVCVASALFCFDDAAEAEAPGCGVDDDCASMTSSCSNVNLSGGGAASSGGASSCSVASAALSQGEPCHPHQSGHHHQHHHHHHHHHHHQAGAHGACRRSAHEGGAQTDTPYSPRSVFVAPIGTSADEVRLAGATAAKSSGGAAAVNKVTPTPVSPAVLAELAQREVAEGSVFCIISAQPSGAAAALATAAAAGGGHCVVASGKIKSADDDFPASSQLPSLDMAELQAAILGAQQQFDTPPSTARSARRPTEGGAVAATVTAGEPCVASSRPHGHGCQEQQVGGALRPLSLIPGPGQAGEPRQRRMTMGGGDGPTQQQQQPAHGIAGSVGSAVAALYQHLPQLRNRLPGSCGSGGGTSPQPNDRERQLPPPAATSSSASSHGHSGGIGSCIAELGVAGHLRVTLTSTLTLLVRELNTPEAMAHRVPIRSMSPAAMQGEKERLKRQLKDVAAAYEALAGRQLTQALKEPLRPVYVRYHKIKALLSSGRAVPSAGTQAGPSGRAQQRGSSSGLVASRPSVVA